MMFKALCKVFLPVVLLPTFGIVPIYAVEDTSKTTSTLKIGALEEGEEIEEGEEGEGRLRLKIDIGDDDSQGEIVKFGEDIEIDVGESVAGDVVAIGGSIIVRGSVAGDVVAIGGSVKIDSTGEVAGDAVAVGGTVQKAEGGKISGDEVSVGLGSFTFPFHFGSPWVGEKPFFKRSFSVIAKVVRIAILLIIALLLAVFLPKPMGRVENTVRRRFFATLGIGILGELLIFPLLVALCVSLIGIPFIPLAVLALIGGLIFGYVGVSLLLGRTFIERVNFKVTSTLTAVVFGVILIELLSLLGRLIGLGGGLFQGMGTLVVFLGFLITYIAWTLGLGAVILSRFGTREPSIASVVSPSEKTISDQT